MTNEQKIAIAESCGLVFNEFDEYGEPEFIGTSEKFRAYENVLMGEERYALLQDHED